MIFSRVLRYAALLTVGATWDDAPVWLRVLFVWILGLMLLVEWLELRYWRNGLALWRERERQLVRLASELASVAQSPLRESAPGTRLLCPKCGIPLVGGAPLYPCEPGLDGEFCPPEAGRLRRRAAGLEQ